MSAPTAASFIFTSFSYSCAALLEPCDGSVRVAARTVVVEVLRNKGRTTVQVCLADNGWCYFNGPAEDIGHLRLSSFSANQIAGIRRKIAATLA